MKRPPKNQHYIPKFILRNFSYTKDTVYVKYKNNDEIISKTVDKLFYKRNLYTYLDPLDNNNDKGYNTEYYFAIYEKEIYEILKNKILKKDEIILTKDEYMSLRLFLTLIPFRSERVAKSHKEDNKNYQWQKDLRYLTQCRSIKEVNDNKNISKNTKKIINKSFFGGDIEEEKNKGELSEKEYEGMLNDECYYRSVTFLSRRGNLNFILGDMYPLYVDRYDEETNEKMNLMEIYPISKDLTIVIYNNNLRKHHLVDFLFGKDRFTRPYLNFKGDVKFKPKKIYEDKVSYLNYLIYKESKDCVIAKSKAELYNLKEIDDIED